MKLFLHLNTFILVPLLVHHILSCKYSETTPKERGKLKRWWFFCLFYFFGVTNVVILFSFYKFMGYRLCQSLWTLTKFMYTTIYKVMKE